ncbi:DUF1576 domain-containing protein [Clostridium thermarum]|uniref:DUF1576 domain-containing protein n=1 Tax=Clostridium thermarum TaxID=1716543 RepID=UPI0013D79E1F|nr:DUF1576 domain-containing protein [Clostridium thermarum]
MIFIKLSSSEQPTGPQTSNKQKYTVLSAYGLSFIIFALLMDSPAEIFNGLIKIVNQPDKLITDYFAVGGLGASFFNAGILTLITLLILYLQNNNITGVSIAAIFLMSGFGLFGKNIFNVWPILLGVFIYSKVQKDKFSKYIYIALFGTSMAPTISELILIGDGASFQRFCLGIFIGVVIGFILPPLSTYLLRVHQGYNLYNVGFTAGIITTVMVSLFKSYGFVTETRLIWYTDNSTALTIFLMVLFSSMIVVGYYLNGRSFKNVKNVFSYSGRLITDFVLLEGFGVSLINMGVNGFIGMLYIIIVGGPLNGPTLGGIFTIVGFSAFGKHIKNIIPIFIGVLLGSMTKTWNINDPSILLVALFGTGLAPIAGQFGWRYGILAGFINSSVALNVGVLHGGLNLYNTGFSAGIVAAFLIPIIEAFRKDVDL